jgi:uncharacterized protein YcgL (UPF0745 family)
VEIFIIVEKIEKDMNISNLKRIKDADVVKVLEELKKQFNFLVICINALNVMEQVKEDIDLFKKSEL